MVSPVRRMWQGMSAQRKELALAAFTGFLASASAVALLGTSGWLISKAAEMPPVLDLSVAAVLVRTFALGRAAFRYVERLLGHDAAFRGLSSLRVQIFERLERLAPVGLQRFARGDVLSRLVGDVDAALDLPLRIVLPWVQTVLVVIGTVAFVIWLAPSSGVLMAVIAVFGVTVAPWAVGALASRAERRIAPTKARMSAAVVSALDATADLTAFDRTGDAAGHVATIDNEVTALTRRSAGALGIGSALTVAMQGAAVVGSLALAIPRVTSGELAPVWLAVAALLPLALFEVIGTLPSSALALERLRGSANRIAELEEQPDPVPEPLHPVALTAGFTGLQLTSASASWTGAQPSLDDISLQVAPGERVAIVGPSGAGKSTLVSVLCAFLGYSGSYRLNDTEVSMAAGDDVRQRIGVLAQRAHIFDTTIGENVRLGRPTVTEDDIWMALEQAQLADAVRAMPQGLDTQVGSFGTSISGGEAQRLALARFLVDPKPVLILDEPTEHLDGRTARALASTLRGIGNHFTCIEVTHRLLTLEPDDRVIVLEAGRIVADDRAAVLAERPGWFAERLSVERLEADMANLIEQLPVGVGVARNRS